MTLGSFKAGNATLTDDEAICGSTPSSGPATDDDGQTIDCQYCESNGLYNVCKPGIRTETIDDVLQPFLEAASMTLDPLIFPDVRLVLMIAMLTLITVKQVLDPPC